MYFGVYKFKSELDADDSVHYENGDSNYYGVMVNSKTADPIVIDGRDRGNIARYINHSHEPNCVLQPWVWKGRKGIAVLSSTTIYSYSEITVQYEKDTAEFFCKCPKCKAEGTKNQNKEKEETKNQNRKIIQLRVPEKSIPSVFWNYGNKLSAFITVLTTFSLHTVYIRLVSVSKQRDLKLDVRPIFYELKKQHNATTQNRDAFGSAIRESIKFLLHFLWKYKTATVQHKGSVPLKYHLMVLTHSALSKYCKECLSKPSNIVTAIVNIIDSSSRIQLRKFLNYYPKKACIIDQCSSLMDGTSNYAPPNVLIIECPLLIPGDCEIAEVLKFNIIPNEIEHTYFLVSICSRSNADSAKNMKFNTLVAQPHVRGCREYNRNWFRLSHDNSGNILQHTILKNTYSDTIKSNSTFENKVRGLFIGSSFTQTEWPHLLYYVKKNFEL
jgi:hypothetical protein